MYYAPKHASAQKSSPARRRVAGVALAGATAAIGSVATAQSASAAPSGVWDKVAQCESGGNWSTSTGNGFYGGLQFTSSTWSAFGGDKFAPEANQASKSQQIQIAQNVLQTQGPGAWPVCSQEAGLTSANGMTGGSAAPAPEPEPQQEQTEEQAPAPQPEPQQEQTQEQAPQPEPQQEAPEQEAAPAPTPERSSEAPSRSTDRDANELIVDGIFGDDTAAAVEQWVGGSVDGNDELGKADIKRLQGKLGVAQDGIVGPVTTSALQETVGANVDGIWGEQTNTKLQQHLNQVL